VNRAQYLDTRLQSVFRNGTKRDNSIDHSDTCPDIAFRRGVDADAAELVKQLADGFVVGNLEVELDDLLDKGKELVEVLVLSRGRNLSLGGFGTE
jgi:hypothetical protein